MIEKYDLNGNVLPTIPTPHDCVIKGIHEDAGFLVFEFEDDISHHESIRHQHPTAKSLIVRFHMLSDGYDLFVYERRKYEEGYIRRKPGKLFSLPKGDWKLEYISHSVGYCSMNVELSLCNSILLQLSADYVEFEWLKGNAQSSVR